MIETSFQPHLAQSSPAWFCLPATLQPQAPVAGLTGHGAEVCTCRLPKSTNGRNWLMSEYGETIKLARVFEKTSANGNRYFIGRLGFAKILIFQSNDSGDGGEAIWDVLVQEAPSNGKRQKPDKAPAAKASSETPGKPANRDNVHAPLNDEIPF